MVRVLVVDHDVDLADLKVDTLRRAGFEVDQCGGPTHALHGLPGAARDAVLAGGMGGRPRLRRLGVGVERGGADPGPAHQYPGKAIVLTSQGMDVGWAQGDAGATVSGSQAPGTLVKAVEAAYARAVSGS